MEETGSSKRKNRRTAAQKEKRRQRERGPWTCHLCDHPPFRSVSGLRDHVVVVHRQRCSWTGQIQPFSSLADEHQAFEKVLCHRRPASFNATEHQHEESVTNRGTASMVATGEPINTIATEDGRAEGLLIVANSSGNINEEENAVDDFNFVATIRAIYVDDDVNFTDADFDVGMSACYPTLMTSPPTT